MVAKISPRPLCQGYFMLHWLQYRQTKKYIRKEWCWMEKREETEGKGTAQGWSGWWCSLLVLWTSPSQGSRHQNPVFRAVSRKLRSCSLTPMPRPCCCLKAKIWLSEKESERYMAYFINAAAQGGFGEVRVQQKCSPGLSPAARHREVLKIQSAYHAPSSCQTEPSGVLKTLNFIIPLFHGWISCVERQRINGMRCSAGIGPNEIRTEDTFFHEEFQVISYILLRGDKPSFLHPERSNILLKSQENNFLDEECFYFLLQEKFNNFSATLLSLWGSCSGRVNQKPEMNWDEQQTLLFLLEWHELHGWFRAE